jgi:hypothetical protein
MHFAQVMNHYSMPQMYPGMTLTRFPVMPGRALPNVEEQGASNCSNTCEWMIMGSKVQHVSIEGTLMVIYQLLYNEFIEY